MRTLALLARHARRELLRGPLALPFVAPRRRRIAQRLTLANDASRSLWTRLAATSLSLHARKLLFSLLYNAPFGPGDAATPSRVFRRHAVLFQKLRAA
jgi:hypothetical protein